MRSSPGAKSDGGSQRSGEVRGQGLPRLPSQPLRWRATPAFAGGVEEDSRWSSASGPTAVLAKNEAARKPPDRITATDASRQGCRIMRRTNRGTPRTLSGCALVRHGFRWFRAATFFATIFGMARGAHHRLFFRTAFGVPEPIFRAEGVHGSLRPSGRYGVVESVPSPTRPIFSAEGGSGCDRPSSDPATQQPRNPATQ